VPVVLVLAVLTVESSYRGNVESPSQGTADTVQFCFGENVDWHVKTFAMDHDIHFHQIRAPGADRQLTPEQAEAETRTHYGDVLARLIVLELADLSDAAAVAATLKSHSLSGTLETARGGLAFYNPDSGHYRTQSGSER
jgi:hypothetical protein